MAGYLHGQTFAIASPNRIAPVVCRFRGESRTPRSRSSPYGGLTHMIRASAAVRGLPGVDNRTSTRRLDCRPACRGRVRCRPEGAGRALGRMAV